MCVYVCFISQDSVIIVKAEKLRALVIQSIAQNLICIHSALIWTCFSFIETTYTLEWKLDEVIIFMKTHKSTLWEHKLLWLY